MNEEQEVAHLLAAVARLLRRASRLAGKPPTSETEALVAEDLALGAYLAFCGVCRLMPEGWDVEGPEPLETDPALLLRAAELLLRQVPVDGQLVGLSKVVIDVCDLVREAAA